MSGNNNLCQGQGTVRHACYPPLTSSEQWSVGTSAPDIVHEPIPVLRGAAGSAQESAKLISIVVGMSVRCFARAAFMPKSQSAP